MSKQCSSCEFFCSTPPNYGKCNITLQAVKLCDRCNQYTPYIPRRAEDETSDTILSALDKLCDIQIASGINLGMIIDGHSQYTCFSCGSPLRVSTRGRRKYCSVCGCYLPEIIYNDHFGDATKMINPMEIPRPKPMPTTISH